MLLSATGCLANPHRFQQESRQRFTLAALPMSGEGEIRTRGTREGTLVFETSTIDHSVTSPGTAVGVRIINSSNFFAKSRWAGHFESHSI